MKNFFATALALASSISATVSDDQVQTLNSNRLQVVPGLAKLGDDAVPIIYVPVSVCAAILGEAVCKTEENGKGLVAIPVSTCIAVLGLVKCSEDAVPVKGSKANDPETLISVPISVCAAVLGNAYCHQHEKLDGLVSIPIGKNPNNVL